MTLESYDTYATGRKGEVLHFEIVVAAGTLKAVVEMLAASYAASHSPEVEAELLPIEPASSFCVAAEYRVAVKRNGFAIIPHAAQRRFAA